MINENQDLNRGPQRPAKDGGTRNANDEIGELFGSSIGRMVLQYQAALRQGLDKEIEKVVDDFQKASVGTDEIVAKRMRSRIEELVSEEIRRVFDNTLQNVERNFADPMRARAAEFGGPEIRKRGPSSRAKGRGGPANKGPHVGKPERHDEQSEIVDENRSRIFPSVPYGYPGSRSKTDGRTNPRAADRTTYEDQDVPFGGVAPMPQFMQQEAQGLNTGPSEGTGPVSPTSWVLPGGSHADEEWSTPKADLPSTSRSESDDRQYESYQPEFQPTDVYFEPDDEVDPFVSSLDDDLVPDEDFHSSEEFEEISNDDALDLPENALTAVVTDNSDLSTIAHDSSEVVHVTPLVEPPSQGDVTPATGLSVASVPTAEEDEDSPLEAATSIGETPSRESALFEADLSTANALTEEEEEDSTLETAASIFEEPDVTAWDDDAFAEQSEDQHDASRADAENDVVVGPAEQQESLPELEKPDATQTAVAEGSYMEDSGASIDNSPEADPAQEDGKMPDAIEAPETAPVASNVAITSSTTADETPQEQEAPKTASADDPEEQPLQVLPGSVEIENVEGEGTELPESATFEGTVRLNVEARGCIKEIVHFVRELRQKPELRLLRLVGNNKEGVDIWLGLREPLRIRTILPEIEGVSISVRPLPHIGAPDEKLLGVRMTRLVAAETVSEVS